MPDMRFAPPPSLRIGGGRGGLNQISVRSFNERLVMSLLLQHNGMSRIELGRISGLSAQTISVIVRGLERDGMISRGEAQRGRVGPPTIPMFLNPEGAFSVGADVGPLSIDVVLIDFVGEIRFKKTAFLDATKVDDVMATLDTLIPEALAQLTTEQTSRVAGIGLTLPAEFEQWQASGETEGESVDLETHFHTLTGHEVFIQDQVTAAAGAVSMFEQPQIEGDYLFCLVGSNVENRLILDHRVYVGTAGPGALSDFGIDGLMRRLPQSVTAESIWRRETEWSDFGDALTSWTKDCGEALAEMLVTLQRFVDVTQMIIASPLPETVCSEVCANAEQNLAAEPHGHGTLNVRSSHLGTWVLAIGAARLPFHSRFMVQSE